MDLSNECRFQLLLVASIAEPGGDLVRDADFANKLLPRPLFSTTFKFYTCGSFSPTKINNKKQSTKTLRTILYWQKKLHQFGPVRSGWLRTAKRDDTSAENAHGYPEKTCWDQTAERMQ
eukprot:TRINITY_DN3832_c0_g1_i1.p1 TRINITY_DN3832_c0_g1~~TRINITY_DN3832_c0_g1_i1.p1  ORF type:complete len:119 (+),score=10.32 TRINITY_DN3832_c0_g1_i1:36-392(+)